MNTKTQVALQSAKDANPDADQSTIVKLATENLMSMQAELNVCVLEILWYDYLSLLWRLSGESFYDYLIKNYGKKYKEYKLKQYFRIIEFLLLEVHSNNKETSIDTLLTIEKIDALNLCASAFRYIQRKNPLFNVKRKNEFTLDQLEVFEQHYRTSKQAILSLLLREQSVDSLKVALQNDNYLQKRDKTKEIHVFYKTYEDGSRDMMLTGASDSDLNQILSNLKKSFKVNEHIVEFE